MSSDSEAVPVGDQCQDQGHFDRAQGCCFWDTSHIYSFLVINTSCLKMGVTLKSLSAHKHTSKCNVFFCLLD